LILDPHACLLVLRLRRHRRVREFDVTELNAPIAILQVRDLVVR
jgi:hypothetical protein